MELQDKVALVTGAASGIGYSITSELLKAGIKGVVLVDFNIENGNKAIKKFQETFGNKRVIFVKADVASRKEYEDAFKQAIETFDRIDIVVNNAGIMNDVDYEKCINTNLTGVTHGTMLGLKYMGKDNGKDGGVIVNISSIVAVAIGHVCPVYGATKVGVLALVRSLGHPFHYNRTGVKILGICPGGTMTPQFGATKFLDRCQEECARLIMERSTIQTPDVVARALTHIIDSGDTASAWVCESNNLYLLKNPELDNLLELVVENV